MFRRSIKLFARIISTIVVSPLVIISKAEFYLCRSESFFIFSGQLLSLMPDKVGSYLRVAYYRYTLKKCSDKVSICFGSYFSHRNAEIGNNVNIGAYCVIGCACIGDDVHIASRVSIPSGKYQHIDADGDRSKQTNLAVLHIGKNTWIGEGAIVIDDVGENCIVAAGCIVVKKVPSNCMVGGNPGTIIKTANKI
jgi:acetyltransferase-like isoleucine patch superfamily enzyme